MRPMAETFFLGAHTRRPSPKGWLGATAADLLFFLSFGSVPWLRTVVAFVPQLGEEEKKRDKGGRGSGGRESINNVRQI